MEITTIGLDLAKNVFQVHGINSAGKVVLKKTLRRSQMRGFFEQDIRSRKKFAVRLPRQISSVGYP